MLSDNLGSVRDVVKYDDGPDDTELVAHLTCDSFGNITSIANGSATPQPIGFATRYMKPKLKQHFRRWDSRERKSNMLPDIEFAFAVPVYSNDSCFHILPFSRQPSIKMTSGYPLGSSELISWDFPLTFPVPSRTHRERLLELVTAQACGYLQCNLTTDTSLDDRQQFVLSSQPLDGVMQKTLIKLELKTDTLFELSRYQYAVLEAASSVRQRQPFLNPVSREEIELACQTPIPFGSHLIVSIGQSRAIGCLSLLEGGLRPACHAMLFTLGPVELSPGTELFSEVEGICGNTDCRLSTLLGVVAK